jgi:7,8-dihydropterin-6-yl-methyl-4-(beta-D-ribofuranosyl)aminobenzene 5'-phosphate synthase
LQALKLRKCRNKIPVHIAESGIVERGRIIDEKTILSIGKPDSEEDVLQCNGQYIYNKEPKTLLDDFFMISGEVPRVTSYEIGLKGHMAKINGKWEKDELIKDEQFLMVNVKGKGIVLFAGCSHFGIVNAVKYAQQLCKEKIYAVFGGFHLSGQHGESIIEQTVNDLKKLLPDSYIIPGHCTGWRAHNAMERTFGKMYNPSFVGHMWKI